MNKKIENFIGGKFQNSKNDTIPIYNPQQGNIIGDVVNSSNDDLKLAIKLVDNVDEAIDHIKKYSSGHTEAILTESN